MPQLAPLSWVFLFCFFWFVLFSIVVCVWWLNYNALELGSNKIWTASGNVWNW